MHRLRTNSSLSPTDSRTTTTTIFTVKVISRCYYLYMHSFQSNMSCTYLVYTVDRRRLP